VLTIGFALTTILFLFWLGLIGYFESSYSFYLLIISVVAAWCLIAFLIVRTNAIDAEDITDVAHKPLPLAPTIHKYALGFTCVVGSVFATLLFVFIVYSIICLDTVRLDVVALLVLAIYTSALCYTRWRSGA